MARVRLVVLVALSLAALPSSARARAPHPAGAPFLAGAASVGFTPPAAGTLRDDPSDCRTDATRPVYTGPRAFAFTEPYVDRSGAGHFASGDPYLDCNHNGRWDGNLLGGGGDTPRFFTHVADPVGARALAVSNGRRTIAVEVVDQEGLFNLFQDRIRAKVAADGYHLGGIFISATHDESAPDTLGLSGVDQTTSGANDYFADHLVARSARAIERAVAALRPARVRYAQATEPANLRQCWSSYPFVDDRLMPTLQAVDAHGRAIATLADVSQHAETLGFNPDPVQRAWVSSDWPHFLRTSLERRYGGVAIEMAGSVGSVETPEVFPHPVSTVPQRFVSESHPAGCRTLFDAAGTPRPTGYEQETRALGTQLANAVIGALDHRATLSRSRALWGRRADVCLPVTNLFFQLGGLLGVFGQRETFTAGCAAPTPPGQLGAALKTSVAAFRIGDGEFISVPGEAFPFTYLRSFLGPADLPHADAPLPPWPLPHMHAPFRFVNGLADDMLGYVFPLGNGVGVPGENGNGLDPSDTDRFGCGHSDDSEAASSHSADLLGTALVGLLDQGGRRAEPVVTGRYVLPGGARSRDPLGGPVVKCAVDQTYTATGPAVAVWIAGRGLVRPAAWMSLSGRPQGRPDRDTRGFFTRRGRRVWLDVFPDLPS